MQKIIETLAMAWFMAISIVLAIIFSSIHLTGGYLIVEPNSTILGAEIVLTLAGLTYSLYVIAKNVFEAVKTILRGVIK